MKNNHSVTARQMALMTFVTQTGVGAVGFSSVLAKEVGHDGWLSILFTGIGTIVLSILINLLLKKFKDKAIYDINKILFGKIAGTCINFIVIIYLLLAAIGGIRLFTLYIRTVLLPDTPPLVLTTFLMIPTMYLAWQGLKNIARFYNVSVIGHVMFTIYMAFIIRELKLSYLMPVGEAGIANILSGMKTSFFSFLGFELITFFYPHISDKDKVIKWQTVANVCSIFFFVMLYVVQITLFGTKFLTQQTLPLFNMTRVYHVPVLERLDLYMIAIWFMPMVCSLRAYVFTSYYNIENMFKFRKPRIWYGIFFVVIIFAGRLIKDYNELSVFLDIINYSGMAFTAYLLLCFIISLFIKKRSDEKCKEK